MKNKFALTEENIKIMVCCHKPCEMPPDSDGIFLPIHVGAAISDIDMGMQRDDQVDGLPCDNISAKNKSYCELTAVYWAWKNIRKVYPDLEYVGLNHYRRFFTKNESVTQIRFAAFKIISLIKFLAGKNVAPVFVPSRTVVFPELGRKTVSLKKTVETNLLKGKEIFCTENAQLNYESMNAFFNVIGKSNIDFLKETVRKVRPEYFQNFQNTLNSRKFCYANMFIMPYALFCNYCEFMFSVLFAFERESAGQNFYMDILHEKSAGRLLGYFGEILTATFLSAQPKEKICRLGVIFVE